ncbi:grpE protein homolog 2, mitochondrial isoform X2 [Lepisosteus oculatus]|uniref:grpE protein homolog 2, mitochondrial isoform X2 n=1 Tax=Lepisosteus oculatus TaxID=7918 RepID=UPI0035F52644
MAIRYLRTVRKNLNDLNRLIALSARSHNAPLCLYSTAAHQRSTGDECHVDDAPEEQTQALTIRMLEIRSSKLEEQVRDLTERYQKALADSDTVRRRTQKFVEDAKLFGIQSFCRDLVEVADILERTASGVAAEAPGGRGPSLQRLCEGLALVQERLQGVFAKHGLEKMRPVGGRYDPYDHEIVCHVAAEGAVPGTISVVKQEGYKLHGRTIRHAHVGVALETQER